MSFKADVRSGIKLQLKFFIQSLIDGGFMDFFHKYTLNFIRIIKSVQDVIERSHQKNTSNIDILSKVVKQPHNILFSIGMSLAFVVFLGEILYFKLRKSLRFNRLKLV